MSAGVDIAGILDRAAVRLSEPGAWTQGQFAQTADGEGCDPNHPKAVSWCCAGAIRAESRTDDGAKRFLGSHLGVSFISVWNDAPSRRKHQVIRALRDAAAKARL